MIDEGVLERPVGGPDVMAEQLRRLLEITRLANVIVRVLPLSAGIRRAHVGHFALLEIPPELGSDVVYIEGHAGDTYLDAASDVELYRDVFDEVLATLSPDGSLELIARYRARQASP